MKKFKYAFVAHETNVLIGAVVIPTILALAVLRYFDVITLSWGAILWMGGVSVGVILLHGAFTIWAAYKSFFR